MKNHIEMLAALTADYLNVFVGRPAQDSADIIKLQGYAPTGITDVPQGFGYSKLLRTYAEERVYAADRDYFLRELSPEAVLRSFSDGRDSLEYNYRIIGEDGKIHLCAARHSRISKPSEELQLVVGFRNIDFVATVGQKKRAEGLYSAYSALSGIFFSMHRVNVRENTYADIKTTPTIQKLTIPGSKDYDANAERIIRGVSSKWSYEEARRFVDRSTLAEHMEGKKHITMDFLSYAAEPCKLHFFREDEDENGALLHVIFAVERVEEEKSQAIINALSHDFKNVFWVDLDEGISHALKLSDFFSADVDEGAHRNFYYAPVFAKYIADRVHPEDRAMLERAISLDHLRTFFRDNDELTGSYRIVSDGEVHHYRYSCYKLENLNSIVAGFSNIDDIIARHMAEEQQQREREQAYQNKLMDAADAAERANKAKTEFLLRMSHDIRTPLNGIRGMLDIADHYGNDIEKQHECRCKVRESSNILLELVNEVLDMSKLESGEVVLERVPFDLARISSEVFTIIDKQAEEQGIEIIEDCNMQHTRLIGSPIHYKRLVLNILGNAIKYNRLHGKVYVSCRELSFDGKTVVLETVIRDTGIGMSEEFQKRLFEPFQQENVSARSKYGGTGLGLSIAKNLTEKMNGTIRCESKKDVGTTFTVHIPFEVDFAEHIDIDHAGEEDVSISGTTVILAEDNDINLEIAQFILNGAGVHVIEARNGEEAVAAFAASKPNEIAAILMDLMMPVMDGYEATRRIRSMDRPDAATIPIIAMTANAFAEDRIATKKAGMNEHIAKPLDAKTVVRVIAEQIKLRK